MTTSTPPPLRPRGAARHRAPSVPLVETSGSSDTRRARLDAERGPASASPIRRRAATQAPTAAHPSRRARRAATQAPTAAHPSRRARRAAERSRRVVPPPTASRRSTLPAHTGRPARQPRAEPAARQDGGRLTASALANARAVPAVASVLATCLFVTVAASPSQAAVITPDAVLAVDLDTGQRYTAPEGFTLDPSRDDFGAAAPIVVAGSGAGTGATSVVIPTSGDAVRPVAGTVPLAGGFGGRQVAGCSACSTQHEGLDFAAPAGTPVVAAMPGTVVHAGPEGGYGLSVVVQHADGVLTRYGHMSVVQTTVGQRVEAGTRIGLVGSTGVSTGPHLHFEVVVRGTHIDPARWLAVRGL